MFWKIFEGKFFVVVYIVISGVVFVIGILFNIFGFMYVVGFVDSVLVIFDMFYVYVWFVGLIIVSVVYLLLFNRVLDII